MNSPSPTTPAGAGSSNPKVYIHEYVDIIGHNRANYLHHITANWSPTGQVERGQQCFGVFAVFGSTGLWPQVINMWEHDGWDGLAASFATEATGAGVQDPKLARWWARAAEFRSGGRDRILVPAPWSPTIEQLCSQPRSAACYAHELISLRPGTASAFLHSVREGLVPLAGEEGWQLVGAWRTAMANDDECLLLWSIPSWAQWAAFEAACCERSTVLAWRAQANGMVTSWQRTVLVDAPLSPLRTGRQPRVEDRVDWTE